METRARSCPPGWPGRSAWRASFDRLFFFFNDTATPEIYTLSLHGALPISAAAPGPRPGPAHARAPDGSGPCPSGARRSEEHTSELQPPYVISHAVFSL